MAIFTGILWIIGAFALPETYAPVLLSKRARNLSKRTGKVYKSRLETGPHARNTNPTQAVKIALSRPWILLLKEPIVLLLSLYMAILYGTLYMLFTAYPIVFQEYRGWSEGIGGLAFLGVAVGFIIALAYIMWDNFRYERVEDEYIDKGEVSAPPEARLPPCMLGSAFIPIGMFWFAWTNGPDLPWAASVVAGAPFGFGMLLVFVSIMNYLIDAYTVYAASVLAANSVLRSLFGTVFPLFTSYMFENLGIHWASSIPAFLALMCVPFPFLFYKYGPAIRKRCAFAKEAMEVLQELKQSEGTDESGHHNSGKKAQHDATDSDSASKPAGESDKEQESASERAKQLSAEEAKEYEAAPDLEAGTAGPGAGAGIGDESAGAPLSQVQTQKSTRSARSARTWRTASSHAPRHTALVHARSYASNW